MIVNLTGQALWNAMQLHTPPYDVAPSASSTSSTTMRGASSMNASRMAALAPDIWLIPAPPPAGFIAINEDNQLSSSSLSATSSPLSGNTSKMSVMLNDNDNNNDKDNNNNTNNNSNNNSGSGSGKSGNKETNSISNNEIDNGAIGAHRLVLCTMSASLHRTISSMSVTSNRLSVSECAPVVRAALQFCYIGRVTVATRWLLRLQRLGSMKHTIQPRLIVD
jgi:hypothetical protein